MSLPNRFWKKVEGSDGCWLWTGAQMSDGYGHIRVGGQGDGHVRAHRLSWEIHHGKSVPTGLQVLHCCDVRLCVRPDHLFIGTPSDNQRDSVRKKRHRWARKAVSS